MTPNSLLVTLAALLLGACASSMSVRVIQPKNQEAVVGKATEVIVKLHENADPSTLRVKLDDIDITNEFSQLPAAQLYFGATPELYGPYIDEWGNYIKGVNKISVTAEWKRPQHSRPFATGGMGITFTPSLIRLCPGEKRNSYYECYSRDWIGLKEGRENEINVYIRLDAAPISTLLVNITPSNRDIVLNNAAAGGSISIEIPTNDSYAEFKVRRVSSIYEITMLSIAAKGYGEATLQVQLPGYSSPPAPGVPAGN